MMFPLGSGNGGEKGGMDDFSNDMFVSIRSIALLLRMCDIR